MPWKVVNLDLASDKPHLHMKDPNAAIHLRSYFDGARVEIGLGAEDPDECFVRASVSTNAVVVEAVKFQPLHVNILSSILASLDVEPQEREEALGWMRERMARGDAERDREGFVRGNVADFPAPTGWPYDLTDDALVDSIRDRGAMPNTRVNALLREASRRGLRVEPRGRPTPEVFHKRPVRGSAT